MDNFSQPGREAVALLPCPFCGGVGDIEQGPASQASGSFCSYRGWCDRCCFGLEWTTDEREARAAWNTRTAAERATSPAGDGWEVLLEVVAKVRGDLIEAGHRKTFGLSRVAVLDLGRRLHEAELRMLTALLPPSGRRGRGGGAGSMSVVFVFGSNLAGRHGKGAALEARQRWGAIPGVRWGRQGNSYAIPTKDENLKVLALFEIKDAVQDFLSYARQLPETSFLVTAIGCGLAGYRPEQIRPMFNGAPRNVFLSGELLA